MKIVLADTGALISLGHVEDVDLIGRILGNLLRVTTVGVARSDADGNSRT